MSDKGVKLEKDGYSIQIKYDEDAIAKRLIKIVTKSGDEVVFSADEMSSILINQVNADTLAATFVETDKVNVVEVARQIECELTEDMKKGQKIRINYVHPYPIEFALIEEAWKIAQIDKDTKVTELTVEYIESVKEKIKPEMQEYMQKFYESFKNLKIKK